MSDAIVGTVRLDRMPWPTADPFLFCVHHVDHYPRGTSAMAPDASLAGRALGQDFDPGRAWRMYHGRTIPGFPRHPHRGFETVTLARRGFIDHSDSLGATARFGQGDVQWMTAGRGVVHSEMFPLLDPDDDNPLELFQIWLNLPPDDKMAEPAFAMLWHEEIPRLVHADEDGRSTTITVIAGALDGQRAPSPPPASWASRPEAHVAIWTLGQEPGARWTLPAGPAEAVRVLYAFGGASVRLDGQPLPTGHAAQLRGDAAVEIADAGEGGELLLLQGRPIGAPVVQHGPFVMNTRAEIRRAFEDYQRTGFGGWPWGDDAPVHPRDRGRFAHHADGRDEVPGSR